MLPRSRAASRTARRCSISIISEDFAAETDANFVMTGQGFLVEVQATAEAAVFTEPALASMLSLARAGIAKLVDLQKAAIA